MRLLVLCSVVVFASVLPAEVLILREVNDGDGETVLREVGSEESSDLRRREIGFAEVAAPGINCISDSDCRVTPRDCDGPHHLAVREWAGVSPVSHPSDRRT